ncbi:MAG: FixH family protein [Planctomycetota bacterium]
MKNDEQLRTENPRAAWVWGGIVVGLLALQIVIGIGSVIIAVGDPSVAVVPDYHSKALAWDDELERRASSDALGWQMELSVSSRKDLRHQRRFQVAMVDALGEPVEGLDVSVRYYHHARGGNIRRAGLVAVADGVYASELVMPRSGLWQVEITGSRRTQDGTPQVYFAERACTVQASDVTRG